MGKLKSKFKYIITNSYIYIKSKGIYPPENLMPDFINSKSNTTSKIIEIVIIVKKNKELNKLIWDS